MYVALPEIGSGLGFPAHHLQWVVSAYAVAFGGFLLLGGRACDLYGPRRMFVLGLSLYAVSSLAGGLAASPALLVAARAVQGVGGAFLFPATLTLVGTLFAEGRERNRAYAVWGATGGSGLIVGALLGGVLTELLGWRAVLYVNVPLAAVAALAALRLIAPDPARQEGRRVDLPGALTSTLGVTCLVLALVQGPESGWTSPTVLTAGGAGAALLAAFLAVEHHGADPLMPLRLLKGRSLHTGMTVTFLYMGTVGSLAYFLTVYFQEVLGYGALRTGLAYLVPMTAVTVGSLVAGRAATRFGPRAPMAAAMALAATGTVLVALSMGTTASYGALIPGFIPLGLGQGAGYTLMFSASASGVSRTEQGIASGMASTTQQVGAAMGLAALVAVSAPAGSVTGLRHALLAAAAGIALTALVSLRFPGRPPAGDVPPVAGHATVSKRATAVG